MTTETILTRAESSVVLNDKDNAFDTLALPSDSQPLVNVLAELETERITWEEGVYRTSNQALYAVLAKCLAIANADSPELAKQRNAALEAFYKDRGYRYKKDAPAATRVVKAVFGDIDRRRLSTYSLVLREAIKQKVLAANLAEWIEQRGGIQEIRLSQSPTFVKTSTKVEIAKKQFDKLPELAVAQSDGLSQLADADFMGECCVLIAEQAANGSFVVRGLTRSSGALSAAFAAMYSEQKKAAA